MFEFLLGTAFGIWIGTLHEFTPYIEIIKMKIKNTIEILNKDKLNKDKLNTDKE